MSGFIALCEQVGYMHEAERVDRYVGGLKPDISHEIMLRALPRPFQPARHPAGRRPALPYPHAALPCPARAPPCWSRTALSSACALPFPSRRPCLRGALLLVRHPALPDMATPSILTFDHEGRPIQFDTWLDDLQLYLLSDPRDGVSLFDLTFGASLASPDTADSATHSKWLTRDAAARLAVRNHLPLAERAHFGQHKTAKAP
ncbi:unnamed protein product [Closterium sp. NIES-53]